MAGAGGLLVVMGLLPKLAAGIAGIPRPVLGGASIVLFGMTAMAGIHELARVKYEGTNNGVIVAVSLAVGGLPIATPTLFAHAPEEAKLFLGSGIFLTAATAVLLNIFFTKRSAKVSA